MAENRDALKQAAAMQAVDFVEDGMILGLGTGSTAAFVIAEVAARLRDGRLRGVTGVPTSELTRQSATELGIPLTELNACGEINLTLDGADEVDPHLRLIKGAGGALVREKIVAAASQRLIIVIDLSKRVDRLGKQARLPIAVVPFGWKTHRAYLESMGVEATLRMASESAPFITDEGLYILDAQFHGIADPEGLEARLKGRTGIVDCGLFLGMTHAVVVGTAEGVQVEDGGRIPPPYEGEDRVS